MGAENRYILTLRCKDRTGIVASVSNFLSDNKGFIVDSAQFGDEFTNKFFLRAEFLCPLKLADLEKKFSSAIAKKFGMIFDIKPKEYKPRILIAVSKDSHCLVHLLHKHEVGALNAEIMGVVSNHNDLRNITERFGYKFHHLPIEKDKKKQEEKLLKLFEKEKCELLVLARYMQILSDDFCKRVGERAINIHHSFLPGFKGAKPYHQAYDRGVKIIGATAHFVTSDLDEGPIIEQEVVRVDHTQKPEDLKLTGQDIESRVLYRAVKLFTEHKVIINGNKTVVF